MKIVGSKDTITFTVSMPDGYIAAVSGDCQVYAEGKAANPQKKTPWNGDGAK